MTIRKMEPTLKVSPCGVTQAQKDAISKISQAVRGGRIDPVEISRRQDGSVIVQTNGEREVSGLTAHVKDIVNVEEMR